MTLLAKAKAFVRTRVAPAEHRLLFAFAGSAGAYPGMGRPLYRRYAAFRESIEAAGAEVEKVLGWPAARFFRGEDERPTTLELARRNNILHLGMLQVAQVDLWRDAGVVPGGVVSVSLGEMIAPYAAGALSRDESVRVFTCIAEAASRTAGNERMFVIRAGRIDAERLTRSAPAPLDSLGLMAPAVSIVLCLAADADAIRQFLGQRVLREIPTDWNYHSGRLNLDSAWLQEQLRDLSPRPPVCPMYSAAVGGVFPAGAPLDAAFFTWMASHMYLFADAVSAALRDGFDTVVTLGSQTTNNGYIADTARAAGRTVKLIDSMRVNDERRSWREAVAAVRSIRFAPVQRRRHFDARPLGLGDEELFAMYDELRAEGSVHHLESVGRWLILGYDDVQRALGDAQRFSSDLAELRETDPVLLASDPPAHTAVRRTLSHLFSAEAVARRSELADRTAERLLQPLAAGRELDVVSDFARPLAAAVALDVAGLDAEASATLNELANVAGGNLEALYARMREPVEALAGRSPLYPELLRDRLDEAAAHSLLRLLWIAGTTPQHAIASAVLLLLEHDEVRRRVQGDPSLLGAFVDEALRLRPPAHVIPRLATEAVEIGGRTIPAGSLVQLSLAAANRDPARFEDPAALRLDRASNPHLSFGGGVHRCIGAPLGRALIITALRALFRVAPAFRAIQPLSTVRYVAGATLRELEQLVIGP